LEGTYRIARYIGEGGMGAVYEAQHARLAGRYAVKFLHLQIHQHPEALARFRREAQITSALRHPGIVQVIDFNTPAESPAFLVMEYLDGSNLGEVIAREAPFPLARVVEITIQVASALAAAHRKGIVHRDLNPNNIFLLPAEGEQPERVKILDFGVSKIRSVSNRITGTTQVLGTPQYMAPEQAQGRVAEIDEAADQFSVAVMIYEMLTALPPFSGGNLASIVRQIVHATPTPLSQLRPDLPPDVEVVISKALAKDKHDRFESISDLASAFRRAAGLGPPPGAAVKHRTRTPEAPTRWDEAGTVISPPGFVERLAAEHAALVAAARTPADAQPTVAAQPPERTTTLGRQTGELTQAAPAPRRSIWPLMTMAVAVAGLVGAVGWTWTTQHRRAPATRASLRPQAPAPGPMVMELPTVQPLPSGPAEPRHAAADQARPRKATSEPHTVPPEAKTDGKGESKSASKSEGKPTAKTETKLASNEPVKTDGKTDGKTAGKADDKTAAKADDKTAAKADDRPDPKPAAPAPRPADDEAQNMETELGLAAIRTEPSPASESCSLTVGSSPWAELWIDGKSTGHQTPVVHLQVDCGRHKLTFKRQDLSIAHDVDVTLYAGDEFKARYRLDEPPSP
jgi:serine/threonine-protein kinase